MIRITTADGKVHLRPEPKAQIKISDWLEREQLPLNTRCNGRGLCRGCLVEIEGRQFRACQHHLESVFNISIPEASQRDHRINGVSSFEVGADLYTHQPKEGYGLALDIGTTTVAAALWDLQTGKCIAQDSVANEQRRFGDNVLSRIDHAMAQGGRSKALQDTLVEDSINPLIRTLCDHSGISVDSIRKAVAAGNTVMLHGLAGAPLSGFAAYPFCPEFLDARYMEASAVGITGSFPLELAANLGPFVGADIALGAYASGMLKSPKPSLLIDFGTNGEILLKAPGGYLATATAAGPAFEGGRLHCGKTAGRGVISSVGRDTQSWKLHFSEETTSTRTRGISGAAYIDFMKHARDSGLLNEMGRFTTGHPEITVRALEDQEQKLAYLDRVQFVAETDVAELIQAKAAIAAGILVLLEEANVAPPDLETIYIAGGFGYHLNTVHAIDIGMIPDVKPQKLRTIGNAALGGASLILLSENSKPIEALRENCRIIELNQTNTFEDHFINSMPLTKLI